MLLFFELVDESFAGADAAKKILDHSDHSHHEGAARATRAFVFLLILLSGTISDSGRAVLPLFHN
jgi:hypothetical protein